MAGIVVIDRDPIQLRSKTERVEPEELFGSMRLRINENARVEHALRI